MKNRHRIATFAFLTCLTALFAGNSFPPTSVSVLDIHVFASDTCHVCEEVKRGALRRLREELGDRIRISYHSLDDIEGFKLLLAYERQYGATDDNSLKLFVGSAYLSGKKDITDNIERLKIVPQSGMKVEGGGSLLRNLPPLPSRGG